MRTAKATFAAGCFWGVEESFSQIEGVVSTQVGYTGGHVQDPTYRDVCTGRTGHAESVKVEFDTERTSYRDLLEHFFSIHDPTTLDRQGVDVGSQYRSAIFYHDEAQRLEAERVMREVQGRSVRKVVTQIAMAGPFYRAEEYHQRYIAKGGRSFCHL
jgi:peptide-methionine (S)-S-oxide reductase